MSHDLWTPQSSPDDDRRPFAAFDAGPGPEPDEWTYENSWWAGFVFAVLLILLGVGIMLMGWKG